jgi:rhodanese-related sulfurtransferase
MAFCVACGTALKVARNDVRPEALPVIDTSIRTAEIHPIIIPQKLSKPKKNGSKDRIFWTVISIVLVVLLGVSGYVFFAGTSKESSVSTTVLPPTTISPQTTQTATTSPARVPLGLGDVNQACEGSSMLFDDQSGDLNFSSTNINSVVVDRWVVNTIRLLVLDCDKTTVVLSLDVSDGEIRVVDYESQYDVLFTKFGPRVLRFGVDGLCCFPEAPLSSAKLLRVTNSGSISTEDSNISRFPGWNPIKNNCDEFTLAGYYTPESLSGENLGFDTDYVTVCSEGQAVKNLQSALINKGYDIYSDGYFGPATLNAINTEAKNSGYMNVHGAVNFQGQLLYARTATSSVYDGE